MQTIKSSAYRRNQTVRWTVLNRGIIPIVNVTVTLTTTVHSET